MREDAEIRDFNDLVSWATWQVIQGIASGEKLRSVMFGVLMAAANWHAEKRKDQA